MTVSTASLIERRVIGVGCLRAFDALYCRCVAVQSLTIRSCIPLSGNQEYINIENYVYLSKTIIKDWLVFGLNVSALCTEIYINGW